MFFSSLHGLPTPAYRNVATTNFEKCAMSSYLFFDLRYKYMRRLILFKWRGKYFLG